MNNKIFLSLVSWRDPFLVNTIKNAIKNAKNPELLVFGCVFDGYEEDEWMLKGIDEIDADIRLIKQDANTASIYLCETRGDILMSLYQDEQYFMQTDCHSKFRKNWDAYLRAELAIAKKAFGEKTILTGINSGFNHWEEDIFYNQTTSSMPTQAILDEFYPAPPVRGEYVEKPEGAMTQESLFNAGMFFATSDFVKTVTQPKDFAFQFEQPIMTLRTFTAGYNMIAPTKAYVSNFDYHDAHETHDEYVRYVRGQDPKWSHVWHDVHQKCETLYYKIVNENIVDESYALFPNKTLAEYEEFSGIDLKNMKLRQEVSPLSRHYIVVKQSVLDQMIDEVLPEIGHTEPLTDLDNEDIFVSIIAWRDPFIVNTLQSLYDNAKWPEKVFANVIFQGYDSDSWMYENAFKIHPNIKITFLHADDTPIEIGKLRGSMMLSQINNEKYFFQIDSHTKLAREWDFDLRAELLIANEKFSNAIIQGHSTNFRRWLDGFDATPTTSIPDTETFIQQGYSAVAGKTLQKPNNLMILEKFYNANCVFAYSKDIQNVPEPDIALIELEQQWQSLRVYTHGYNLVSPTKTYTNCFDYYEYEVPLTNSNFIQYESGPWHYILSEEYYVRYTRKEDAEYVREYNGLAPQAKEKFFNIFWKQEWEESYGPGLARGVDDYIDFIGYNPVTLELLREPKMLEEHNWAYVTDEEIHDAKSRVEATVLEH